jgi:hypothetical protein
MEAVCQKTTESEQKLFMAVKIMDEYLSTESKGVITSKNINLVALTCVLLAIKMDD